MESSRGSGSQEREVRALPRNLAFYPRSGRAHAAAANGPDACGPACAPVNQKYPGKAAAPKNAACGTSHPPTYIDAAWATSFDWLGQPDSFAARRGGTRGPGRSMVLSKAPARTLDPWRVKTRSLHRLGTAKPTRREGKRSSIMSRAAPGVMCNIQAIAPVSGASDMIRGIDLPPIEVRPWMPPFNSVLTRTAKQLIALMRCWCLVRNVPGRVWLHCWMCGMTTPVCPCRDHSVFLSIAG